MASRSHRWEWDVGGVAGPGETGAGRGDRSPESCGGVWTRTGYRLSEKEFDFAAEESRVARPESRAAGPPWGSRAAARRRGNAEAGPTADASRESPKNIS